MTPKDKLIVLATTFGLITEGLTVPQLQEALDANPGYQEYQKAVAAAAEANAAKATAEQKEANAVAALNVANHFKDDLQDAYDKCLKTCADLQSNLDAANAKLEVFAQANTEAESAKIYYTSKAGEKYEVTQEQFRFQGQLYKAAEAVTAHSDVFETLVANNSFILKKA